MRAPELANGAIDVLLSDLSQATHARLIMLSDMQFLRDTDRTAIIEEFAMARKHLVFYMKLKCSFWRQLPWQLFGLADPRPEESCGAAARSLALYARATDEARSHWLVVLLLAPSAPGQLQLDMYKHGFELSTLPILREQVCNMRFSTIVERWIESRHARVHHIFRAAANDSALHLGFSLTIQPVQRLLASGVELSAWCLPDCVLHVCVLHQSL